MGVRKVQWRQVPDDPCTWPYDCEKTHAAYITDLGKGDTYAYDPLSFMDIFYSPDFFCYGICEYAQVRNYCD